MNIKQNQALLQSDNRDPFRKPKLLILGHGRHGKDTVAEILRDRHGFSFISSSLYAAEKVVRPALEACDVHYPNLNACYEDRVNFRAFWYEAIKAYNRGGTSRLAQGILSEYDMYVGMRSADEYAASKHLFDHVFWVDASGRGVPFESKSSFDIEFNPAEMTLIPNDGSLEDLEEAVAQALS